MRNFKELLNPARARQRDLQRRGKGEIKLKSDPLLADKGDTVTLLGVPTQINTHSECHVLPWMFMFTRFACQDFLAGLHARLVDGEQEMPNLAVAGIAGDILSFLHTRENFWEQME